MKYANISNKGSKKSPHLFDFPSKDEPDVVEGLGGLLPVNNGDDFEELLFENRMKRKRRQKRKN